jgi:Ca-activated chloride channel family protein
MFERPALLIAVPVLTIAVGALAVWARGRRVAAARAWSQSLGAHASAIGRWSPMLLALVALAAAIGLAGPRWGLAAHTAESRALNVAVVMDVSRSMLAQDVAPNRLGRAVSLARRLVEDLGGDRFAMIAFAGNPYLLTPLTLDQSAISLQLDALDPDMASLGGSGLAAALEFARKVLVAAKEGGDRAVVVFTDGESFEGTSALESAGRALARSHVTLIAVPVGGVRGARIPDPDGTWHRDANGNVVITTRHDELLQAAVHAAGGVFIPASAPDPVGDARRALAHLHRSVAADRTVADQIPRAWIFALLAVVLLLAHTLTRRSAALAVLALAALAHPATAQRPSRGNRMLRRGDTVDARRAFTAEARALPSDSNLFNAGTSALTGGDFPTAELDLQRAANSVDPALRQRALYNLGTAYLRQARHDSTQRDTLLASATASLQQSLLLAPDDRNAKFNFELARRLRPPPPPHSASSSGTGKNNTPPPPRGQPSAGRGAMTPAEAEQVLSAMERAERDTRQAQYQRGHPGEPLRGPDW